MNIFVQITQKINTFLGSFGADVPESHFQGHSEKRTKIKTAEQVPQLLPQTPVIRPPQDIAINYYLKEKQQNFERPRPNWMSGVAATVTTKALGIKVDDVFKATLLVNTIRQNPTIIGFAPALATDHLLNELGIEDGMVRMPLDLAVGNAAAEMLLNLRYGTITPTAQFAKAIVTGVFNIALVGSIYTSLLDQWHVPKDSDLRSNFWTFTAQYAGYLLINAVNPATVEGSIAGGVAVPFGIFAGLNYLPRIYYSEAEYDQRKLQADQFLVDWAADNEHDGFAKFCLAFTQAPIFSNLAMIVMDLAGYQPTPLVPLSDSAMTELTKHPELYVKHLANQRQAQEYHQNGERRLAAMVREPVYTP